MFPPKAVEVSCDSIFLPVVAAVSEGSKMDDA